MDSLNISIMIIIINIAIIINNSIINISISIKISMNSISSICLSLGIINLLGPCQPFITQSSLQWRHNGHDGVSNNQPHDCSLNRLFMRRSKETSKLRITGLCDRLPVNSRQKWPVTRKMFPFDDIIMCRVHMCIHGIENAVHLKKLLSEVVQ